MSVEEFSRSKKETLKKLLPKNLDDQIVRDDSVQRPLYCPSNEGL